MVFLLVFITCISCVTIVSAFDGDFVTLQHKVLKKTTENESLIIENNTFYFQNLLSDKVEVKENTEKEISISDLKFKAKEMQREYDLAVKNSDYSSSGINMKYPFYITHTTTKEYDKLLKGSKLEGYGYCFKKIEDQYGVNGIFAMAVATLESGLGKSNLGQHNNNFYGIRGSGSSWAKFDSVESGILYFGKLMNNSLYYGKTIKKIAPIYCNDGWADKVSSIMTRYINELEDMK